MCGVRSSFTHSIVWPFLISIVSGEYLRSRMLTCAAAGATLPPGETAGVASAVTGLANPVSHPSSGVGNIAARSETNHAEEQNRNGKRKGRARPFDRDDETCRAQNRQRVEEPD
jgi:hypothetical protein